MKMMPVIDSFRAAPIVAPPTTERETNMHKNFGSLLNSLLVVFEKFGYKEFSAGA
jgi:molecular chaperone GrpE (heat shock protein)